MSENWGKNKQQSNIKVYIRVRPLNEDEPSYSNCIQTSNHSQIEIKTKQSNAQNSSYTFDYIFDQQASQASVFKDVAQDIIDNAFLGVNGTILCYGQTCSGKTYTCIGDGLDENKGLLPRVLSEILDKIENRKNIEGKVKISMIEIYNEKVMDLMNQTKTDLKIRSNKNKGIFVENAAQKYICSEEQANFYISKGMGNRSVAPTSMNSSSSRSHMLILLTLHQRDHFTGQTRVAKITLVDLAGSEKTSRSDGKLLEEAKKINTSLTVLGKVINSLSEGKKHVPFRDSKLTRLLEESIGGNSLTSLIINISPSNFNEQQTLSSLRFGFRAKSIKNSPKINREYTVPQLLQILEKTEKKVKDQQWFIKIIMEEKGFSHLSVNQFINIYRSSKNSKYNDEEQSSQAMTADEIKMQHLLFNQPLLLDGLEDECSQYQLQHPTYYTPKTPKQRKMSYYGTRVGYTSKKIKTQNYDSSDQQEMLLQNLGNLSFEIPNTVLEANKSQQLTKRKYWLKSKVYDLVINPQKSIKKQEKKTKYQSTISTSQKKNEKNLTMQQKLRMIKENLLKIKQMKKK